MSARILYVEKKVFDEPQVGASGDVFGPYQFVRIELRQWKDGEHRDTILDELVVVDGAEAVRSSRVIHGGTDAANIRHAISTFDELCSAHPWATKEDAR